MASPEKGGDSPEKKAKKPWKTALGIGGLILGSIIAVDLLAGGLQHVSANLKQF
jgi:hypothetical protein